jgi:hypothetical protein
VAVMVNAEKTALILIPTIFLSLQVSTYVAKRFPNIEKGMMVSRGWKEDIKLATAASILFYVVAKGYSNTTNFQRVWQ